MRVIVDANAFLSFLIYPQRSTAVSQVVTRIIAGDFELVFPPGIAGEMRAKVHEKPYFRERIPPAVVEDLLSLLAELALTPKMCSHTPVQARGPKDQYLLDAAEGDDVEFLITDDKDLLDLAAPIGFPLIVTPAQFLYLMTQPPGS